MGLGSTAKKLQQLADIAEKLYAKVNEILDRLADLHERMEETGDRVDRIDRELAEQRAIVEALAEREGVDVDAVLDEVDHDPERSETGSGAGPDASVDRGDDAGSTSGGADPADPDSAEASPE